MAGQDDMQRARSSAKLTYADFVNFPDDGLRHELIDGEHFVTPAPERRHQRVSGRLYLAIASFLAAHPLGEVYYAPLDVILSDFDVVEPDLLYVSKERSEVLGRWVHGAPDLVIEILSPTTRRLDETIKRALYDRVNVAEYWIVDPIAASVRVFRRATGDRLALVETLSAAAGDAIATPLLPGFRTSVAAIFEE